ncbi:MAG: DUF4856 domain-containing protein [Crocinitomicaceae bacterium]|nr:DUF4856 domain-containing protein [Crocinitomicaceae bacterium]
MKTLIISSLLLVTVVTISSCKKGCTDPTAINYDEKAKKDDNTCQFEESYTVPTTYSFMDASGNSTVSYSGQTERLDQLSEMVVLMKTGTSTVLDAQVLKDMFSNENGNGNGNFSFTSTKQLKNKCFTVDQGLFETFMDALAIASVDNANTASDGVAGTLSSGSSTYLFDENGVEHVQVIEKGLMGAVFLNQALNVYFGSGKMDVDNTTAVDVAAGDYYTAMEHHFDEAFGYFGVDTDFPSTVPDRFWGKYCNNQDALLNSNADMMNCFLRGRAAISANELTDRDQTILALRKEWEEISAYQAIDYIDGAIANFGTDDAKFLHELSEAYAFAWNLRYAPVETRRMDPTEHAALMAQFPTNFWSITLVDLNNIKNTINAIY